MVRSPAAHPVVITSYSIHYTKLYELHRADIEVILDVVYNHSAEGDDQGPTFCFRGIDNEAYYLLDPLRHNTNYSGRGNTLNCSHRNNFV